MDKFSDQFMVNNVIDWNEVSKDYAGLMIRPFDINITKSWYNAFKDESCCVWNTIIFKFYIGYPSTNIYTLGTIERSKIPYRNFINVNFNEFKDVSLERFMNSTFPNSLKPLGKWYAIKNGLIDRLYELNQDERNSLDPNELIEIKKPLYELKYKVNAFTDVSRPDPSKILQLNTEKDMLEFSKKYTTSPKTKL